MRIVLLFAALATASIAHANFLSKSFLACIDSSKKSEIYKSCSKASFQPCKCKTFTEANITFSCNVITADTYNDCLGFKKDEDRLAVCMASKVKKHIAAEFNKKMQKIRTECGNQGH